MLKVEQLRCFLTAIAEGSFSEAGRVLNLSASAVAYNVEALEHALNTGLLLRRPSSGVTPTAEGLRLQRLAEPLLRELLEMEQVFSSKGRVLKGELVVGCQEGLSWSLVPRAIERLTARHPQLRIIQKTVFMDEGNAPVLNGAVDVLITFVVGSLPEPAIDMQVLCEPNCYAMMRANHPLAGSTEGARLEDLARYPQIFIVDGPAYGLFTGLYRDKGLTPEQAMVSNISTGAQSIIGRCDHISLRIVRPAHALSPLGDPLAFIPILEGSRRPSVVASCARRKNGRRPPKVEAFVSECRSLFDDGTMRAHMFY